MKYISLIFIFFLASCGGSNNPFNPVAEDGLIDTPAPANIADDPVEPEPIAAPQPTPEPISQPEPEPINEPITQPETEIGEPQPASTEVASSQLFEEEPSMNFEDYFNQTWECEQFGLQEGGNKSRLVFREDGTGLLSFASGITGSEVVSGFTWSYADGDSTKIQTSFASLFVDIEKKLLTSGVPENPLDHEYRCYFPDI